MIVQRKTNSSIRVSSGHLVDPFNLKVEDCAKIDFIHSICLLNRYTGHSKYPFSVGQHSYVLANHVPKSLRKAAIIHDFSEALFNDIASPVKARFHQYREDEEVAQKVIFEYFGVPWSDMEELHPYDKAIFMDERQVLFDIIEDNGKGMGDDRVALGIDPEYFKERDWRTVKSLLTAQFKWNFTDQEFRILHG
jgi:uncharacterized protein